jgi:ABC-type transport system involved in cytochrome c biogenesis permease subunit
MGADGRLFNTGTLRASWLLIRDALVVLFLIVVPFYFVFVQPVGGQQSAPLIDLLMFAGGMVFLSFVLIMISSWPDIAYYHSCDLRENDLVLSNLLPGRKVAIPYTKISSVDILKEPRYAWIGISDVLVLRVGYGSVYGKLLCSDISKDETESIMQAIYEKKEKKVSV